MNIQAEKNEAKADVMEMKIARELSEEEILLVSGGDNSNGGQNHDPVPDEEPAHDIPNPWIPPNP
jgi:hypothetical protein